VAKAAPDGHTLILSAASHTINASLYAKLPYDAIRDFTGVAHIGTVEYVLMVSSALRRGRSGNRGLRQANPGRLNYTTAGSGTATHLSMAYLRVSRHRHGACAVQGDQRGGERSRGGPVARVIAANIGALGFIKDARVRMLGVTSTKRSKFLPELPTLAEAGVPGYEFDSWLGLLGPAGFRARRWRESTSRSESCSRTR